MGKMNKILGAIIVTMLFTAPFSTAAAENKDVFVKLDGDQINFAVQPEILNGTTLVQFRPIFEKLGLKIVWDGETQTITGTNEKTQIQLIIGQKDATVNGKKIELAEAPKIVNGNTLVPLRFVGESSGRTVIWDENLYGIYIIDPATVGKLTDVYGNTYEGQIKDGKPNGKGKVLDENGVMIFDGEFVDNKLEGLGTMVLDEELTYIGEIHGTQAEGKGKILTNGKLHYEGGFHNNGREGFGTLYDTENGSRKYEGQWKNDLMDGIGKEFYDSGKLFYEGEYSQGVMNGTGKIYNEDGSLNFEGQMKQGRIDNGKVHNSDGTIAEIVDGKVKK